MMRFPGRYLVVVVMATLTACASSNGTPTVAALSGGAAFPQGMNMFNFRYYGPDDGPQTTVAAAASEVFKRLDASYEALAIPLTRRDSTARILGNEGFTMRRELGKIQLRKAFSCGGSLGMPNSETYTITASIMSMVVGREANSSVVTTIVSAFAVNPNFPEEGVECASTGVFEEAIAEELQKQPGQR